jgi:hypothetical protein
MSPTHVVRRLTAIIALLAILGFALPATAAPGARHPSRAHAVQVPSLLDQLLSWIGSFLPGQTPVPQGPAEKAGTVTSPSGGSTTSNTLSSGEADRGAMIDPNG